MNLYVHYRCGSSSGPGWRSFDATPTLRFERIPVLGRVHTRNVRRFLAGVEYSDVCKVLPIASGACAGVYASHVLEQLSLEEFHIAIGETHHILRKRGHFRLFVRDLFQICRGYVQASQARGANASHEFMRSSHLGLEKRRGGLLGILRSTFGNSDHLWMRDAHSMSEALNAHKFTQIKRVNAGDSEEPASKTVEDPSDFTPPARCRPQMLSVAARDSSVGSGR